MEEFKKVIFETKALLHENDEWNIKYEEYANLISERLKFIECTQKQFHIKEPFAIYLNKTNMQSPNKLVYSLRFLGQRIADICAYRTSEVVLTTKSYEKNNIKNFGCEIELLDKGWDSKEAKEFRSFFTKKKMVKNKSNEEHRIESLLLKEFSKQGNKPIENIKPVRLNNKVRFSMPTPISASDEKHLKYNRISRANIDILVRKGRGKSTKLSIIELKDENKKNEQPIKVLKQGLAYATFLSELLHSKSGDQWWRLYGFSGKAPEVIKFNVICCMPTGKYNDYSFKNLKITDKDEFEFHYIYFNEKNNELIGLDTSLK